MVGDGCLEPDCGVPTVEKLWPALIFRVVVINIP